MQLSTISDERYKQNIWLTLDNNGLIKKDGSVKTAALNQIIQRSIDVLRDKANCEAKEKENK